ncbi:g1366 [Coccomyxa elongata]
MHVQNCYAVPHNESNDQVSVDITHHRTLYDLHHKVNAKEQIVGWYATGSAVTGPDALIQDFYASECTNAVHLTVDTAMESGELTIAAYVARKVSLGDRLLARKFQRVEVEVKTAEVESIGVPLLKKDVVEKLPTDLDGLQTTIKRLHDSLEQAHAYVDDVVTGKRQADITLGRYLADTMTGIPHLGAEEFETMLSDTAQDSLLIMYLSNLVRAHLALTDRLGTASLPLL